MWTTVLQTTALYAASQIITHHASDSFFQDEWDNPAVQNSTAAAKDYALSGNTTISSTTTASQKSVLPTDGSFEIDEAPVDQATAERLIGDAINGKSHMSLRVTLPNGTVPNETISAANKQEKPEAQKEGFYTKEFPLDMLASLILCTLQYYWLQALERALPARSRRWDAGVQGKQEMDEDREEEVVKRWIAQGRVRRASLNWCNTLLKWVLSLTVGRVWYYAVGVVVRRALRLEAPGKSWWDVVEASCACLGASVGRWADEWVYRSLRLIVLGHCYTLHLWLSYLHLWPCRRTSRCCSLRERIWHAMSSLSRPWGSWPAGQCKRSMRITCYAI